MSPNSTIGRLVFTCIRLGSRIYWQVLVVFHSTVRQILSYNSQWRLPSLSLQLIIHRSSYLSRQYILRTERIVKYPSDNNNNNRNLSPSPSLSTVQVLAQLPVRLCSLHFRLPAPASSCPSGFYCSVCFCIPFAFSSASVLHCTDIWKQSLYIVL